MLRHQCRVVVLGKRLLVKYWRPVKKKERRSSEDFCQAIQKQSRDILGHISCPLVIEHVKRLFDRFHLQSYIYVQAQPHKHLHRSVAKQNPILREIQQTLYIFECQKTNKTHLHFRESLVQIQSHTIYFCVTSVHRDSTFLASLSLSLSLSAIQSNLHCHFTLIRLWRWPSILAYYERSMTASVHGKKIISGNVHLRNDLVIDLFCRSFISYNYNS